jgi:hypothetical protein
MQGRDMQVTLDRDLGIVVAVVALTLGHAPTEVILWLVFVLFQGGHRSRVQWPVEVWNGDAAGR